MSVIAKEALRVDLQNIVNSDKFLEPLIKLKKVIFL